MKIERVIDVYTDRARRRLIPLPTVLMCDDINKSARELTEDRATRKRLARAHVSARAFVVDTLAMTLAVTNQRFPSDRHLGHNRALLRRYRMRLKTIDLEIQPEQ